MAFLPAIRPAIIGAIMILRRRPGHGDMA